MDLTTIHYLNVFLGAGAIILQILSVIALLLLFFASPAQGDRGPKKSALLDFIEKHFLILGFLISLLSSLFSLVYSEVIGFAPCPPCWFQRIFMYPQVFIFGVAVWNNFRNQLSEAKNVIKYSTPLLGVGFFIAVYQNLVYYFGGSSSVLCGSSGVSCFQHLVSEFGGYISLPMLSLTSFFALLAITLVVHFYKKN